MTLSEPTEEYRYKGNLLVQTDHDLLIRIETKLDMHLSDILSIKDRLTLVERTLDRQAGFLAGGKAIWVLIGAVPGIVGFTLYLQKTF